MKRSKPCHDKRLKPPTHAWVLALWNQWFGQNRERFHYPLFPKQVGGYRLIMRFQGLHPDLSFEISMDGASNGIYFWWDRAEGRLWDCLCERDLLEYQTADGRYFCGYCLEDKVKYYPSREAQWQQHVFEEMLI